MVYDAEKNLPVENFSLEIHFSILKSLKGRRCGVLGLDRGHAEENLPLENLPLETVDVIIAILFKYLVPFPALFLLIFLIFCLQD